MSFVTRPNALLGMLALAAFAIALAFTNRDRLPSAEIVIAGDGDAPAAASAQRAFPKHDQPPPPPANAPPAEQPALAREPTAEQLQTIARLSEQVMPPGETTSEDAEKRGDAIRQLATLPGPQAAQALVHAVRNDVDLSAPALQAYLQYGKGRHPARLNLADCFAYALAKRLDVPLLYKGDDFAKTDIRSAL